MQRALPASWICLQYMKLFDHKEHIVAYHVSVSASLSLSGLDRAMLKHYMFEGRGSV